MYSWIIARAAVERRLLWQGLQRVVLLLHHTSPTLHGMHGQVKYPDSVLSCNILLMMHHGCPTKQYQAPIGYAYNNYHQVGEAKP